MMDCQQQQSAAASPSTAGLATTTTATAATTAAPSAIANSITSTTAAAATESLQQQQQHQDLQVKTRKLQIEIEEKNEIINYLKEELETLREKSDKISRENLQLVKDAKRVKFLQDENDFLQDKVNSIEKLELELNRLKEKKSNELDYLNLRISELEDDKLKAQEETNEFEVKLQQAQARLARLDELQVELTKWKSFANELEQERDLIKTKLLESIEQETQLNSTNKKVEDEVKRLRDLIRLLEEQRDEEQASNSLSLSVANDLKRFDQYHQKSEGAEDDLNSQLNGVSVERFEKEQQTDSSETREVAIGTEPDLVSNKSNVDKLANENQFLRGELDKNELRYEELADSNRRIRQELDGNKVLISELRQDLACEKSIALKLANQLSNFTKQIKSLDKQYFPIHDTTPAPPTATNLVNSNLPNGQQKQQQREDGNKNGKSENNLRSTPPPKGININNGNGNENKELASDNNGKQQQQQQHAGQLNRSVPITTQAAGVNRIDSPVAGQELNGFRENKLLSSSGAPTGERSDDDNRTPTTSSPSNCAGQQQVPRAGSETDRSHQKESATATTAAGQASSQNGRQLEDGIELDSRHEQQQQSQLHPSPPPSAASAAKPATKGSAVGENNGHSANSKLSSDRDRTKVIGNGEIEIEAKQNANSAASLGDAPKNSVETKTNDRRPLLSPRESRRHDELSGAGSPTPIKSNFTRNSLPSRSVNYRHSKSSFAFLDRIRASVSATTNTKSSFNEQSNVLLTNFASTQTAAAAGGQPIAGSPQVNNLSNYQHHQHHLHDHLAAKQTFNPGDELTRHRLLLNCLLDHQHSSRCYTAKPIESTHVQAADGLPTEAYQQRQQIYHRASGAQHRLNHQQHQQQQQHNPLETNLINQTHNHNNHHHHHLMSPIRSSRQVSALIDPVSSEQLMLTMMQQHHAAHLASNQQPVHLMANGQQHTQSRPHAHANESGGGGGNSLSEQQMALIYRQHYYHHLHQLHQMHHHVHLHHKHHHNQQQQHASEPTAAAARDNPNQQTAPAAPDQHVNLKSQGDCLGRTSSSQFYAPDLQHDLIYANVNCKHSNNNNANGTNLIKASKAISNHYDEKELEGQHPVNNELYGSASIRPKENQSSFQRNSATRKSHSAIFPTNPMNSVSSTRQPIGEVNGLPNVLDHPASRQSNNRSPSRANNQTTSTSNSQQRAMTTKLPLNGSSSNNKSHQQASSSASSSPTSSSSSNSTNLSPSSATSSTSSINSLSASTGAPLLSRTALRRTTGPSATMSTDDRRQFSVERELIGSAPMTATLSRVGSCRGPSQSHHNQMLSTKTSSNLLIQEHNNNNKGRNSVMSTMAPHQNHQHLTMSQLMQEPIKLQQPPPMKTSKILNIGHQQQQQQQPSAANQQRQQVNLMARNLADIKLSDNLAFSSLRLPPKKSSSGSNLINSSFNGKLIHDRTTTASSDHSTRAISGSSSPSDKSSRRRLLIENTNTTRAGDSASVAGQKSSVRFEYGCV